MKSIVLADGDGPDARCLDEAWPGWSDHVELVVAADGGARHAGPLGLPLHVWVGDGDSIGEDDLATLAARGVLIRRSPAAKDESDTELAVLEAIDRGADDIVVLGAFGGARLDHTIANLGLLAMPQLADRSIVLLDDAARVRLVRAPAAGGGAVSCPLPGRVGDLVSLLPFGPGVERVVTHGLAYPLRGEPLPAGPARGLSNVRDRTDASVTLSAGLLLVIETPDTLPP